MQTIIIVEDNDNLREAVVSYLKLEGFSVKECPTIKSAVKTLAAGTCDLMILDVMLPDGDGFLFAKHIRSLHNFPIIFLTARASESDRVTGFELGGDDYLVKPFSNKELVLRVKALLRRSGNGSKNKSESKIFQLKDYTLTLNLPKHEASIDGKIIQLTAVEWKILLRLSENPELVVSREQLLKTCMDYVVSQRTIDTHIKNLRKKLIHPQWIITVRGFGYRFGGGEIV